MYIVFRVDEGMYTHWNFKTESLEEVKRIACKSGTFEIWEADESIEAELDKPEIYEQEPYKFVRVMHSMIKDMPSARWVEGCIDN